MRIVIKIVAYICVAVGGIGMVGAGLTLGEGFLMANLSMLFYGMILAIGIFVLDRFHRREYLISSLRQSCGDIKRNVCGNAVTGTQR